MKLYKVILSLIVCAALVFTGCVKQAPQIETSASRPIVPLGVVKITEDIDTPTIWIGNKVYVIKQWDFHINSQLSIEPGAVIKFHHEEGPTLTVTDKAAIIAKGVSDKPIVFTSYKDDSYGGDSNGDQKNSSPKPGDWNGIYRREWISF